MTSKFFGALEQQILRGTDNVDKSRLKDAIMTAAEKSIRHEPHPKEVNGLTKSASISVLYICYNLLSKIIEKRLTPSQENIAVKYQ